MKVWEGNSPAGYKRYPMFVIICQGLEKKKKSLWRALRVTFYAKMIMSYDSKVEMS